MNNTKTTYKQTEIGSIPSDWEVKALGKVSNIIDSLHQTPKFAETGYAMVRVTDIKEGSLNLEKSLRVDKSIFNQFIKNHEPKQGNIVMSRVGSYGISSYVQTNEPFCMGQNTVVIEPLINSKYLYFILNSPFIKVQVELESFGTGYKSLSLKSIKELLIPLPKSEIEQTAIATALSDADAYISALEKLIAKKRLLKQAAMQELLKPKDGWVMKKLGEICENIGSGKSNTNAKEGNYPIYGSTGIIGWSIDKDYSGHKILIARVGANAGQVNLVHGQYCVSDNTLMITVKSNIDMNFIFFWLISFQLNKLVFGSGQPLITGGQLKVLDIYMPDKLEQTRIATILSDMDSELTALDKQLQKVRQIKQGMMQELLTGKIRLI